MSCENPFEGIIEKPRERFDLLGPRVPAKIPPRRQVTILEAPGERVAAEEAASVIQKSDASFGMPGNRYRNEIIGEHDGIAALQNIRRKSRRGTIGLMNPHARAEMLRVGLRIADVVPMPQADTGQAGPF